MTATPPAMRPWEAEHVEVHASQSEPRLCGFHVLSRHRKTFCRDISCRVKFRRLDGEPHSSMTDAASKVPARHLTRPALAFVVAGGLQHCRTELAERDEELPRHGRRLGVERSAGCLDVADVGLARPVPSWQWVFLDF